MTKNKEHRGYQIIEPPIYEKLNWDMDSIVACLEVIRHKLPEEFKEFPKELEYDLLSLGNPHGLPYPVIGVYASNDKDFKKIPDFLELYDLIENWIDKIGVDNLKKEAFEVNAPSWKVLEKIGYFPER